MDSNVFRCLFAGLHFWQQMQFLDSNIILVLSYIILFMLGI